MKNLFKILKMGSCGLILASLLSIGTAANAHERTIVITEVIPTPPPAFRIKSLPPVNCARPAVVLVDGHWNGRGVWVSKHYVYHCRNGLTWVPKHYVGRSCMKIRHNEWRCRWTVVPSSWEGRERTVVIRR